MALAETAKLAVQLDLKDKLTGGLRNASRGLSGLSASTSTFRQRLGSIARLGAIAFAGIATAAGSAIAVMVRSGLGDLAILESAVTSVDGAIAQMGLTGKVTGAQVATWADEIERSTQAAFDDKAIAGATANLIRYGKVGPANLRPAMVVMTDLAAKTGDVDSASNLLGKALANPAKAAGKLARMGIYLSDSQQTQIEKMQKAGDLAGAQAILLDALAGSTSGAAAAMNGPYADAMNMFDDTMEDARKALAVGFMPVLQRVADLLSTELAKPETKKAIEAFGNTLATGFDKFVTVITKLPWAQIGASLSIAANAAGTLVGAFMSMPPEVQATIVALAGLNKLSGGAVGSLVGALGSGLIKGVLGLTAGVVNIKAAVVNGGGGKVPLPGGGGPGGGGGNPLAPVGGLAGVVASIGGTAALLSVAASVAAGAAMLALPYIFEGKPGSGPKDVPITGADGKNHGSISWQNAGQAYGNSPGLYGAINRNTPAPMSTTQRTPGYAFQQGKTTQRTPGYGITAPALRTPLMEMTTRLGVLQRQLHQAKEAGDTRRAAMLQGKVAAMKQAIATESQKMSGTNAKLTTTNAKLNAIQRKKWSVVNKITIPVDVSIRNISAAKAKEQRVNRHHKYRDNNTHG